MINQWISGLLGLVVTAVPFLTLSETTLSWTLIIVGLAIAASSFWGMFTEPRGRRTHNVGRSV
jgi:heme/copper-type cytochrome/quinol oxidase subunit 4